MKSIFEYTMEMAFLNTLLVKNMINNREYHAIRDTIADFYKIDVGVEKFTNKAI